jgi:hypothetical protein
MHSATSLARRFLVSAAQAWSSRARRTSLTLSITTGPETEVIPLAVWIGSMALTRMLVSSP